MVIIIEAVNDVYSIENNKNEKLIRLEQQNGDYTSFEREALLIQIYKEMLERIRKNKASKRRSRIYLLSDAYYLSHE